MTDPAPDLPDCVAYGPGFAADPVDDAARATQLARMSACYLLARAG